MSRFILLSAFVVVLAACSGEDEGPNTPPIEEWCDIERPLEDCYDEGTYIVNEGSLAEAKDICAVTCDTVRSITINGGDAELLKVLKGFRHIGSLTINHSHSDVNDLVSLTSLEWSEIVTIADNGGLTSLHGLENLRKVGPGDDVESFSISNYFFLIEGNSNLTDFSALDGLEEAAYLQIMHNGGFTEISGFPSLTTGSIQIFGNSRLTHISGFDQMSEVPLLEIQSNASLKRINGFQNLKTLRSVTVDRNRQLQECELQRIFDQLDEPPERMTLEDLQTNGTCD